MLLVNHHLVNIYAEIATDINIVLSDIANSQFNSSVCDQGFNPYSRKPIIKMKP